MVKIYVDGCFVDSTATRYVNETMQDGVDRVQRFIEDTLRKFPLFTNYKVTFC